MSSGLSLPPLAACSFDSWVQGGPKPEQPACRAAEPQAAGNRLSSFKSPSPGPSGSGKRLCDRELVAPCPVEELRKILSKILYYCYYGHLL